MLIDSKWAVQTPSTLSEDLVAGTTVAFLSDPIDLVAAGYTGGGGKLSLALRSKASTAAVGTGYTIEILHCDTVGGTYSAFSSRTVARADCAAGKFVGKMALGPGLLEFVKVQITGAASMTGSTTFNAAIVTE